MKFRKVTALFMAAAVLGSVGLTGCSSQGSGQSSQENSSTGSGDLLAQIQERGEIVIAMEGTWAPWTYHDESGTLVGLQPLWRASGTACWLAWTPGAMIS